MSTDRLRRMPPSGTTPIPSPPPKSEPTSRKRDKESEDQESEEIKSKSLESADSLLQSQVQGKWYDLSRHVSEEKPASATTLPPEGDTFPKRVGTNEWLHADGRVYKKLMFVIRKDRSEALDVVLATTSLALSEDRSEVVRNLLDHVGIKAGRSRLVLLAPYTFSSVHSVTFATVWANPSTYFDP